MKSSKAPVYEMDDERHDMLVGQSRAQAERAWEDMKFITGAFASLLSEVFPEMRTGKTEELCRYAESYPLPVKKHRLYVSFIDERRGKLFCEIASDMDERQLALNVAVDRKLANLPRPKIADGAVVEHVQQRRALALAVHAERHNGGSTMEAERIGDFIDKADFLLARSREPHVYHVVIPAKTMLHPESSDHFVEDSSARRCVFALNCDAVKAHECSSRSRSPEMFSHAADTQT